MVLPIGKAAGALLVSVGTDPIPPTQFDIGPVSAKFIRVPLLLFPEASMAVDNPILLPPATPWLK